MPDVELGGKVNVAFIRFGVISRGLERSRDVIDTQSLFEYDGALFRLYFQPALSPPGGAAGR